MAVEIDRDINELSEKYPFSYETIKRAYLGIGDYKKTVKFLNLASKISDETSIDLLLVPLLIRDTKINFRGFKDGCEK